MFEETYRMYGYYTDQANRYEQEFEDKEALCEEKYTKMKQMEFLARFCERVLKEMSAE